MTKLQVAPVTLRGMNPVPQKPVLTFTYGKDDTVDEPICGEADAARCQPSFHVFKNAYNLLMLSGQLLRL